MSSFGAIGNGIKVEAPKTDHLREFPPKWEVYYWRVIFPSKRNKCYEECNFNFYVYSNM
jgi:hypothetical protein